LLFLIFPTNMHSADVSGNRERELKSFLDRLAPSVDRQDNQRRIGWRYFQRLPSEYFVLDSNKVAFHGHHKQKKRGNEDGSNPRSLDKFCDQHDDYRGACCDRSQSVDEHASARATAFVLLPVRHHSRLRKRKSQEGTDGVERYQSICHAAENDQKRACQNRQDIHAQRINQAPSTKTERIRQIAVQSDCTAQSREVSECSICRQGKNDQNRADGNVIKNAAAGNSGYDHGQDALVSGRARVRSRNMISAYKV